MLRDRIPLISVRNVLALCGVIASVWVQSRMNGYAHVGSSGYSFSYEGIGWPRPYFTHVKRFTFDGTEVAYTNQKRLFGGAILAIAVLAIHVFASWCTARMTTWRTQFSVATAIGVITGICTGLGVYFSLSLQQEFVDILGSAGIGLGAFWGIHLLITRFQSRVGPASYSLHDA